MIPYSLIVNTILNIRIKYRGESTKYHPPKINVKKSHLCSYLPSIACTPKSRHPCRVHIAKKKKILIET